MSRSVEHRSALAEGARLQSYIVERVLGAGGFGITYKAREDVTDRPVAIKEYLPSSLAVRDRDGQTVMPVSEGSRNDFVWGLDRFRQEARLLITLRHPNIVPTLSYFEANGTAYLVMEYQDGQTLAQIIAGGQALDESEVREFLVPLLDGVEAVHKAGLLHRDIKPDNIFLRRDGQPVLIDFGSARQALGHQSLSLTAVVTDGYAPFEQYEREGAQGAWTDIYALGAVAYRCITGQRPPTATTRLSASYRKAEDPASGGLSKLRELTSRSFAAAIESALAVAADERPQTVADFRAVLADTGARPTVRREAVETPRTLLAGTHAAATAATATATAAMASRRRRVAPIYAALGLVLLIGGGAAAYFTAGGPRGSTTGEPTLADLDARRQAEAEARRKAEEDARRKADEDARRRAEDDARKAEEETKRRAEDEAKRRAEDEAKRRTEDDAERRRREEEARRRAEEEKARTEEARRRAEDEAKRRAEEDARRKAEEAERARLGHAAAPSYFAPERRRGSIFFAHQSATIEASGQAALTRLQAYLRQNPNTRVALAASVSNDEGTAAEEARLRAQRGEAVRSWLVQHGVAAARLRVGANATRGDGQQQRYVAIAVDVEEADRPDPDTRPPDTRPPGTTPPRTPPPDASKRYTAAELRSVMYRLIKGAAMSGNIRSEVEGALSSSDGPSALAVCVNWEASTPERAEIGGAYHWTARSGSLLVERTLQGCQSMARGNCQCVLVDSGSSNVLQLPPAFVQRYAR